MSESEYDYKEYEVLEENIIWPWQNFWRKKKDSNYSARAVSVDANMKYSLGKFIYEYIQKENEELKAENEQLQKENERLRKGFDQALRQWRMYIEDGCQSSVEDIVIEEPDNIEAQLYLDCEKVLRGKCEKL